MFRRSLLACLPLLALTLPATAATDPLALPGFGSDPAKIDCQIYVSNAALANEHYEQAKTANNDLIDALNPKAQAESQAQMSAALQTGNYGALAANAQAMSQSQGSVMQDDAECIEITSSNTNTGLSQAVAGRLSPLQRAFITRMNAAPADPAQYKTAYTQATSELLTGLNNGIAQVRGTAQSCLLKYDARVKTAVAPLKGAMRELSAATYAPELRRADYARILWNDLRAVCESTAGDLGSYATYQPHRSGSGYARSGSSGGALSGVAEKVKDTAVGKALDKAFGSLFGK